MRKTLCAAVVLAMIGFAAAGCTDPYSPGQRALGGGAIGAGAGALLGGVAGGEGGALTGAVIGGAVGALGGAATTPERPQQRTYEAPPPQYRY